MKLIFSGLFFLLAITLAKTQSLPTELQALEIVSLNRMPMRASAFAYENVVIAGKGEKEKSRYFLSLNGLWKFKWVKDPRERPLDFFKVGYDDGKWDNFRVPANWELNGYGLPIYVNQAYEFAGKKLTGKDLNPPFDIPIDNNPVGSYRKRFILPENWNGRQVFIHLGAVKSAFFIWVNGNKVGYSEDSKLAAEYDITKYVSPGENTIALQVYRWSDGSYLECQDMWRISGIERDVYLYATPKIAIQDFKTVATLDQSYKNGFLSVSTEINSYRLDRDTNHTTPDTFSVQLDLRAPTGKLVYSEQTKDVKSVLGNFRSRVAFKTTIKDVLPWTAETPSLYTLFITLLDKNGQVLEVVPQKIGFRTVEISKNNLLVNGKRIYLKGVNRHEHNAKQGHCLTHEDMRKDMEMMKKLNINAVRNSHYPPDPYWMELCDEYGLYVVDEANIESHGRYYDLAYTLGNDKQWLVPHMERIKRMYERDKNHPSVIVWSLGNEAGNGVNFYEGYEWLKTHDDRPVQYERAEMDYNTDIVVPQYPHPGALGDFVDTHPTRPLIMSEYAHIMGNSLGNFKEYWEVIESRPALQGGFIWEWIDQSLDTLKNGKRITAYGGDFPLKGAVNEDFSDNNFCVKGVVTAYRKETPMSSEIKKVYQYIKTTYNNNTIRIHNSYCFRNLDNVSVHWDLLEDGKIIEKGIINSLNIDPGFTKPYNLDIKTKAKPDYEYFLNVSYKLIKSEPLLDTGFTIAEEQFTWKGKPLSYKQNLEINKSLPIIKTDQEVVIKGADFEVSFDILKGLLSTFTYKDQLYIEKGPTPSFWRAPTDNDIGAEFNTKLRNWRLAYQNLKVAHFAITDNKDGSYQIKFKKKIVNGDATVETIYEVNPDGTIKVRVNLQPLKGDYPLLLRFGTDMELNKDLKQINYYGRGPGENYWDRKTAAKIGLYQQSIDEQYYPYARPQESGNKSDVRWVNLLNKKGKGIRIAMADTIFNFSALPYSLNDLDP
jgi:beta-galactosidase